MSWVVMIKKRHNEQDMCGTGALVHQKYTVYNTPGQL